ncbi:MAG: MBL fold metallo-hydrolase [Actinomycetaceae bacterium]|nr:MBL fold metallo-hydrolase [Actinomycetaceae bacterium]
MTSHTESVKPVVTCTFLGASGTVTGSKYLLTIENRPTNSQISQASNEAGSESAGEEASQISESRERKENSRYVLIDAGMFQGEKKWRRQNWATFVPPAREITDILITHAHADHVGYLPALVKQGFRGRVWATPGTIDLAAIVLRDAGQLQMQDAKSAQRGGYSKHENPLPLFTPKDVEAALSFFEPVEYDEDVNLDGFTARWVRAGHILGSASIHLNIAGTTILFSGDLGRDKPPLLIPREAPPHADWVIMESTYGDREHETSNPPHEPMAKAIRDTAKRGGKILIPTFAIDRTEAVMHQIVTMIREGRIPSLPVFVDSPMGLKALDVYQNRSEQELRHDIDVDDFMGIPQLVEARTPEDSKRINYFKHTCIIVTSSGMMEGGRVLHHLERMLPDPDNTVIITGFQAEGTRGRKLIDGAKNLKMHGWYVPVRASIVQDREFSVHAGQSELLKWVAQTQPEGSQPHAVFLTHGEVRASQALQNRIHDDLGWNAAVPEFGEKVRLSPTPQNH